MKKKNIYIFVLSSLILTSCLEDDTNPGGITYQDAEFNYEFELLEDNRYNEIRRYDTNDVLLGTINYEYDSASVIKRIYNEDDNLSEIHYYELDTNDKAVKSTDTVFNGGNSWEVSNLTYKRDTNNSKLKSIVHNLKVIENKTVTDSNQFVYSFTFNGDNVDKVLRTSQSGTCNDQYYYTDSINKLDVYAFRNDKAFTFDGRIIGDKSEHLTKAISLNYNCYSSGVLPPEILMNYQMNDNKRIDRLVYIIVPSRSAYGNNNITADRITHNFTYINVD